jgi:anti-sigma factor (TIGR02949 family)
MNCTILREKLVEYLDGELAPDAAKDCAGHIEGCSACRARVAELQSLRAMVRRELNTPAPAGLKQKLLSAAEDSCAAEGERASGAGRVARPASLRDRHKARWSWFDWGWLRPALGIAAVLMLVFIIPKIFNLGGRHAGSTAAYSQPADVVALRYGEQPAAGQDVGAGDIEMGGLDLQSPL